VPWLEDKNVKVAVQKRKPHKVALSEKANVVAPLGLQKGAEYGKYKSDKYKYR